MTDLYYMQDTRHYTGNSIVWWRKGCSGYTSNILNAEVWTKEKAFRQHKCRETDLPWPKEYIDNKIYPVVDFQRVDHEEAMKGKD